MEYKLNFNKDFFQNFKKRWLSTKELVLLLANLEDLIIRKLIKVDSDFNFNEKPKSNGSS